jgi:Mg-chelatase subunit ChlD
MNNHPMPTTHDTTPASASKSAEIAVILDRSGSMESIASDAIGGFNAFITSQRTVPGSARVSLVLFDDRYEVAITSAPLDTIPLLTRQTFVPRGSTALLDAIGHTLKSMTEAVATRPPAERPDTIIVAILTDGEENASHTYSLAHISDLIAEKRAQGWEFVFLAANQDAIATASRLSIDAADTHAFAATAEGTRASFREMHALVRLKRGK